MDPLTLHYRAVNAAKLVVELREKERVCRAAKMKASAKELRRRIKYAEDTVLLTLK